MALDTATGMAHYDAPEKDLYEIGEMPPLGYVPKRCMHGPSAANAMANLSNRSR
jgi:hypothetical protein